MAQQHLVVVDDDVLRDLPLKVAGGLARWAVTCKRNAFKASKRSSELGTRAGLRLIAITKE